MLIFTSFVDLSCYTTTTTITNSYHKANENKPVEKMNSNIESSREGMSQLFQYIFTISVAKTVEVETVLLAVVAVEIHHGDV